MVFTPGWAWANVPTGGGLDEIMTAFVGSTSGWEDQFRTFATQLFWILVLIDFVIMAIRLIFTPDDFSGMIATIVRRILVIGLFFAFIYHDSPLYGPDLAINIKESFDQAGTAVVGHDELSTPSGIFSIGFNLMVEIFDKASGWRVIDSLGFIIAGYILMIIFALIAAMLLLVTIQFHIYMYAGLLLLGFGGMSYTRDIAIIYFKAIFATAMKLFIMTLILAVALEIYNGWVDAFDDPTLKQMGMFIGTAIVLLALVKSVPDMVSDMISGFSIGSGDAAINTTVRAGTTAATVGVAAVTGGMGGIMAVKEAVGLAKDEGKTGVMGVGVATIGNLAKTGMESAGQKLRGQSSHSGTAGGKVAEILKKHRLTLDSSKDGGGSLSKDTK